MTGNYKYEDLCCEHHVKMVYNWIYFIFSSSYSKEEGNSSKEKIADK